MEIIEGIVSDKMLIPSIIHFCWFGRKPIPKEYKKYIDGWKKIFVGYEFVLWNEENFPFEKFPYASKAYKEKKYAFVSDVARVYALYNFGGIYFDTDVEVIKDFKKLLLKERAVLGVESNVAIGTGFMAFEKNHPVCKYMLEYYQVHDEYKVNGNEIPNTHILANYLKKAYGVNMCNNEIQRREEFVLYPQDFFTAYDGAIGENLITTNTYCAHHFGASWIGGWRKGKEKVKRLLRRLK